MSSNKWNLAQFSSLLVGKTCKGTTTSGFPNTSNKFVTCSNFVRVPGTFACLANENNGKLGSFPLVAGHKGKVLDVAFSPFNDNLVASVSEDGNGRLWSIPDGGLTETMVDPTQTLIGHKRKVGSANFHPTAENILATTSTDYTVKVWDIEKGEAACTVTGHSDIIQSVDWNYDGSLLATTSKDKKIRVIDPRGDNVTAEATGHPGVKGSRCIWLGDRKSVV